MVLSIKGEGGKNGDTFVHDTICILCCIQLVFRNELSKILDHNIKY